MARPLRIEYEEAFYHVTARGNEQGLIFKDRKDREKFLEKIAAAYEKYGITIHGYVLMNNHYHLLLETPQGNLTKAMHLVNTGYTTYFNTRHSRIGHLFQGRYKAILVDKDSYLLELSRYIHLNPVRAKLTKKPQDYPLSSYPCFIEKRTSPNWLETKDILAHFEGGEENATKSYQLFVEEGLKREIENPLKGLFAQSILGDKSFIKKIQKFVEERKADKEIPTLKQLRTKQNIDDILGLVASRSRSSVEEIKTPGSKNRLERQIGLYLVKKYTDLSLKQIGEAFGVDYSSVSTAYRRIEKKREKNRDLKTKLKRLEERISRRQMPKDET